MGGTTQSTTLRMFFFVTKTELIEQKTCAHFQFFTGTLKYPVLRIVHTVGSGTLSDRELTKGQLCSWCLQNKNKKLIECISWFAPSPWTMDT